MATKITRWETDNGMQFDTQKEAEEYERTFNMERAILAKLDKLTTYGSLDPDDVLRAIRTDSELRETLREYLKD